MPKFDKAKGFSAKFMSKSPFKHGDGTWGGSNVSPATQEMLDAKKKFSASMPEEGDYTQEQYDEYDEALSGYRARIEAGE